VLSTEARIGLLERIHPSEFRESIPNGLTMCLGASYSQVSFEFFDKHFKLSNLRIPGIEVILKHVSPNENLRFFGPAHILVLCIFLRDISRLAQVRYLRIYLEQKPNPWMIVDEFVFPDIKLFVPSGASGLRVDSAQDIIDV
jgi:hypothetical protein